MPDSKLDIGGLPNETGSASNGSSGPALLQPTSARSIVIIDSCAFTRGTTSKCLQVLCPEIAVFAFSRLEDGLAANICGAGVCLTLYNAHSGALTEAAVGEDLMILTRSLAPRPLVVLSDLDRLDCVQEAFERGARGYIPTTSSTLDVAVEVIRVLHAAAAS